MENEATLENILRLLHYNPATGEFVWKEDRRRVRAGCKAGTKESDGYIRIRIGERAYRAHRMAWAVTFGRWPAAGMEIDHIDGNKANNAIENLREVTRSQNEVNKLLRDQNKTGVNGVIYCKHKKRYRAIISMDKKIYILGYFETKELAAAAYKGAAVVLRGKFRARYEKGAGNKPTPKDHAAFNLL